MVRAYQKCLTKIGESLRETGKSARNALLFVHNQADMADAIKRLNDGIALLAQIAANARNYVLENSHGVDENTAALEEERKLTQQLRKSLDAALGEMKAQQASYASTIATANSVNAQRAKRLQELEALIQELRAGKAAAETSACVARARLARLAETGAE